jgi:hypothetical protein
MQAAGSPPALDVHDANVATYARLLGRFSRRIDAHWHDWRPRLLATALSTHARLAVGLADILRIRRTLDASAPLPVDADCLVADLEDKIARLGAYIDDRWPDPSTPNGHRFLQLYGANVGRLARLYRHRCAVAKLRARRSADRIAAAFDQALDQLGEKWGIEL